MEFPTSRSIRIMTSVSILLRMIGAAMAVTLPKGFGMSALQHSCVGDGAGNCRGCGTRRARQMGPGARPLPANKIAVGSGDRALPRGYCLTIGSKTHRASRFPPLEAGIDEDPVEPLRNSFALDGFG